MARRGRNGADHNASKHKSTNSGSVDMSPSDISENFEQKEGKVFDNVELPNGIFHGRTLSPKGKSAKKNKSSGKKSNERYDNSFRRQKPKDKTPHYSKTESVRRDADHFSLSSDSSKTPFGDNLNQGNSSGIPNGSFVEAQGFSDVIMGKNLGGLAMHVLKAANGWVEKQKPHINTFTTVIHDAHDYVCLRIKIAYPIIQTWVLHLGQIMFLLSMVWLDCGLRGLSSLLHLGTTSFFAVIWCSILSVIAMVGITKMLIIMVIASLVAVFIGLALGVLIVAFSATVILWMYGSFWTTGLVTAAGAVAFALRRERVALFLTTIYSAYCAKCYVGWLGLLLALNLSFISSDVLIYILKNYVNDQKFNSPSEQDTRSQSSTNNFYSESMHAPPMEDGFQSTFGRYSGHDSGATSTSGAEPELTPENEVSRLLNCNDHYSALGFARYENIDTSSLKREYRKKAMLVHPDKNMGNEKAAEAFKKLQNAYEVLLDSLKRKTYDDELRREELLHYFRRFQGLSQKNSRHGAFSPGFSHHEHEDEGPHGESRRIACKKCNDFHIWICTNRSKTQARICQDCKAFHQAKDGDGWVEQSFQPVMFGLLHKMDPPLAYVCAESRIYDVTEWFICQGMRCPPNTHKPSFHVNTSLASKYNAKGSSSSNGGSGGMRMPNVDDTMTEEEFFEWLQNAMQSETFDSNSMSNESPSARTGAFTKNSGGKKKRRGKKQW